MENKITATKTFRYEISANSNTPEVVLYVLHGYGQQAKYFIRKFQTLFDDFLVVAPEGMHRFYLKASSGRVGASWMTKEAREDDIADNIRWLNDVDERISAEFHPKRKILLGFSQGGATAARWHHKGLPNFDALILWACVFPPDLKPEDEINSEYQQHFVLGEEDEFYDKSTQSDLIRFYKNKGFSTHRYAGVHDIHIPTLKNILSEINQTEPS